MPLVQTLRLFNPELFELGISLQMFTSLQTNNVKQLYNGIIVFFTDVTDLHSYSHHCLGQC